MLEDLKTFQMIPKLFRYQHYKCLFDQLYLPLPLILSPFIHWVTVEIRLKRILRTTLFHVNI